MKQLYTWLAVGIIITGILLRLLPLIQKPLQMDEAWTLYFANTYTYRQLLLTAPVANDIHPGLYYGIVKFLLRFTGNLYVLRFTTVLAPHIAGIIFFVFWSIKRKLPQGFSLIALFLLSFSPFLILHSWQLRMYGFIFLWTIILGALLFDHIYFNKNKKILLWMLPFMLLSQAMSMSGYLLTLSIIATVITNALLSSHSIKSVIIHYGRWINLSLLLAAITVSTYYPFHFSTSFFLASWVNIPTPIRAINMFPIETLGLPPASRLAALITCVVLLIIGAVLCLHHRLNQKILLSSFFMIWIIPLFSFIFSNTSQMFSEMPFFYKIIPPISIFLPRFFLSQAIYLYILIALIFYQLYIQQNLIHKLVALFIVFLFSIAWIPTIKSTTFVTTNEQQTQSNKSLILTSIAPAQTLFYPGYTSLYSFDPQYNISEQESVTLYLRSANFEEKIKKNIAPVFCKEILHGENTYILIQDKNVPDFFLQFEPNLNKFTEKYCVTQENNKFTTLFSCRCQKAL